MRKRGLKNQGLKAVCTLEAAIQENVVVKIRECNAASQEVRRVFRSRRQRPAIKCAWPAPQAERCRGTQAPRLCRFGKFDSPERVMRLDFVSFGAFWLHHSIYNSSLLGYKGLLWYQGAGLGFLQ